MLAHERRRIVRRAAERGDDRRRRSARCRARRRDCATSARSRCGGSRCLPCAFELASRPGEQRDEVGVVEAVAHREVALRRRLARSGSTGRRAGSRRSRRRDCRSAAAASSGMLPVSSIVRYEMQRRASSSYGATIAPVGQASMHARAGAAMRARGGRDAAAAGRCRSRRGRNTSPRRASAAACACRASRGPTCAASATSSTGALSVNTR